ncbi:MAG: site-specific DNA-methyltransferase [Candidatus Thiodiazotropha taylori]|nr:site-specific DNA-methyltransferase [Candidatus Thiodiazotropha taylori]MCW4293696.1 site-specific DNA-methyltransferase [Candidatus Thiodiazotropha taylori]
MKNYTLPRLDEDEKARQSILPHCRLAPGAIWTDPVRGHRIGCVDATDARQVSDLMGGQQASLAVHDPPYNLVAFETRSIGEFINWCARWIETTSISLCSNAGLYVWLGADQSEGFQPLPDFMLMMRGFKEFSSRSLITMRNQRGYGTQKNWMAVRQECLYYTKGSPVFAVQYTDIPKILRGYYKEINGKKTENMERSKSENIRPGNVWVDVQQVFYRMEENVNGCYAQKPIKAIERLVAASSSEGDTVIDFFGHSGTTLIAADQMKRRCLICDIDPIYCEIMIRRLERLRAYGKTGWQNGNPFEKELHGVVESEHPVLELW